VKTRIISGIFLVIILALTAGFGGWLLFAACLGISIIGMFELNRVKNLEKTGMANISYIFAIVYYLSLLLDSTKYNMITLILAFLVMMSFYVFKFPKYKAEDVMWTFFAFVYVAIMISYIYLVRSMHDGIYLVWLIFVASWGNDTFAYFTGVFLGKHKMAPILSPKKSVEGAIGGVLGAAILGAIYGLIISRFTSSPSVLTIATFAGASFVGAFISIIGDLAASAIKRNYDVKDYGNLIPGHGGILDRFDSVIFTAPVVYWIVYLILNVL
jgi:phosphatidate cytidylyltransferase